jgi:hypothetical protein
MEALRIIGDDHRDLWRVITTVDLVADEIDAGSAVDAAFFAAVFDYFGQFMEGCHHRKENEHLFPFLSRHSPAAAAVLERLQALRGSSPQLLDALREKSAALPDKAFVVALREYSAAVKTWIRIEETKPSRWPGPGFPRPPGPESTTPSSITTIRCSAGRRRHCSVNSFTASPAWRRNRSALVAIPRAPCSRRPCRARPTFCWRWTASKVATAASRR